MAPRRRSAAHRGSTTDTPDRPTTTQRGHTWIFAILHYFRRIFCVFLVSGNPLGHYMIALWLWFGEHLAFEEMVLSD